MVNNRKRIILLGVIMALIISATLIVTSVNANKREHAHDMIVGKTFEGFCSTVSFKWRYRVEFISETHCNVYFYEAILSNSMANTYYITEKNFSNVPYSINGGVSGVTFTWGDKYNLYAPAEPIRIIVTEEGVELYTPNFNSGCSMELTER